MLRQLCQTAKSNFYTGVNLGCVSKIEYSFPLALHATLVFAIILLLKNPTIFSSSGLGVAIKLMMIRVKQLQF
jgi:hypothetical protein